MTKTQSTSTDAFYSLENLPYKRRLVFNVIDRLGEACNLDIAQYLRLPINRITPRTNELVKLGLVEESKKDYCKSTGKKVIYWKIRRRNDFIPVDETGQGKMI